MSTAKPQFALWFEAPVRTPWAGLLALVLCGAALAYSAHHYFGASDALQAAQAQAAEAQRAYRARVQLKPVNADDANARAQRLRAPIHHALSYDWNAVLSQLEQGVQAPWVLESMEIKQTAKEAVVLLDGPENIVQAPGANTGLPAHWRVMEVTRTGDESNRRIKLRVLVQL